MDLMLTSFGVTHIKSLNEEGDGFFDRMPPALLADECQEFMPDYAALLFADRIIIDIRSYERLISNRFASYGSVAETIKILNEEGFVRIEDYDSVIQGHRADLKKILKKDLQDIASWIKPLEESIDQWKLFHNKFRCLLLNEFENNQIRQSFYASYGFTRRYSRWLQTISY